MKRKLLIAGIATMLCSCCGCLKETPLTDREMNMVAEYTANKLLEYDTKNISGDVLYTEAELALLLTPTPTPTPEVTPVPTAVPGQTDVSGANGAVPENRIPTVTPTPIPDNTAETNSQLTAIMKVPEGMNVSYLEQYEIADTILGSDSVMITAEEGMTYVKVVVKVENTTDQPLTFDAPNNLEYSLDINLGTRYKTSISMLENDLQFVATEVPAGAAKEMVLLFEVKKTEINTAHLIMQNDADETVFIKLK